MTEIVTKLLFGSGVKCPSIRRDPDDAKKEIAEPFAAEAKFFVESRLLQRDVKIILEGVSNQNLLLATVLHPVSPYAYNFTCGRWRQFCFYRLGLSITSTSTDIVVCVKINRIVSKKIKPKMVINNFLKPFAFTLKALSVK